jgi:hypothetical protein
MEEVLFSAMVIARSLGASECRIEHFLAALDGDTVPLSILDEIAGDEGGMFVDEMPLSRGVVAVIAPLGGIEAIFERTTVDEFRSALRAAQERGER